jgi:hypothetical protein
MLPTGSQSYVSVGLHGKHAMQRGIWVPTQNLLWEQEKPRKTLRRTLKSATPNTSPYLCCCVFLSFFLTSYFYNYCYVHMI